MATYNKNKEAYYKNLQLVPGVVSENTFPLSLTHLDRYIKAMKDKIDAKHGALVASKPPPSEIMLRTQRRKKSGVKVGSGAVMSMKSQKRGTGFGSTKSNVLFAGQMLRYENVNPILIKARFVT